MAPSAGANACYNLVNGRTTDEREIPGFSLSLSLSPSHISRTFLSEYAEYGCARVSGCFRRVEGKRYCSRCSVPFWDFPDSKISGPPRCRQHRRRHGWERESFRGQGSRGLSMLSRVTPEGGVEPWGAILGILLSHRRPGGFQLVIVLFHLIQHVIRLPRYNTYIRPRKIHVLYTVMRALEALFPRLLAFT